MGENLPNPVTLTLHISLTSYIRTDGMLVTGGNDGCLSTWDAAKDFEKLEQLKIQDGVGSPRYCVSERQIVK
jgi:hypothetical protein